MQNIPSAFQNGGKQLQILGDIHLGGAGFRAVSHRLVKNRKRKGAAQVIGIDLAVQREVEADILNITGRKVLAGKISRGAAGQCIRCHIEIPPIKR